MNCFVSVGFSLKQWNLKERKEKSDNWRSEPWDSLVSGRHGINSFLALMVITHRWCHCCCLKSITDLYFFFFFHINYLKVNYCSFHLIGFNAVRPPALCGLYTAPGSPVRLSSTISPDAGSS